MRNIFSPLINYFRHPTLTQKMEILQKEELSQITRSEHAITEAQVELRLRRARADAIGAIITALMRGNLDNPPRQSELRVRNKRDSGNPPRNNPVSQLQIASKLRNIPSSNNP